MVKRYVVAAGELYDHERVEGGITVVEYMDYLSVVEALREALDGWVLSQGERDYKEDRIFERIAELRKQFLGD